MGTYRFLTNDAWTAAYVPIQVNKTFPSLKKPVQCSHITYVGCVYPSVVCRMYIFPLTARLSLHASFRTELVSVAKPRVIQKSSLVPAIRPNTCAARACCSQRALSFYSTAPQSAAVRGLAAI